MDSVFAWLLITGLSLIFGAVKYAAAMRPGRSLHVLSEFLNQVISIFIGGTIIYFFAAIRLPLLELGSDVTVPDILLLSLAILAFFGWLPYVPGQLKHALASVFSRK